MILPFGKKKKPEAVDDSTTPLFAQDVLRLHRGYWQILLRYVLVGMLIVTLVGGLLYLEVWLANQIGGPAIFTSLELAVSTNSIIGGMGVLATVIVALQVSVRSKPKVVGDAADAARQLVLESLAMLSGTAAIALGLVAIIGREHDPAILDPMRSVAPLLGGLLLAAIAADAASATDSDFNKLLDATKAEQMHIHRSAVYKRETARTKSPDMRSATLQLLSTTVPGLLALIGLNSLAAYSSTTVRLADGPQAFFVVFLLTIVLAASAGSFRHQWFRRQHTTAILLALPMLPVAASVVPGVFLFLGSRQVIDARSMVLCAGFAVAIASSCFIVGIALSTHFPYSERRGLILELVLRGLARPMKSARSEDRSTSIAQNISLVVTVVALPPLGIFFARRVASRIGRRSGTVKTVLVLGYLEMIALLVAAIAVAVANPTLV